MGTFIALLRGINVGGRFIVRMSELRELCSGLGWREVRTYIQSGNIVFEASSESAALEAKVEKAIAGRFGCAPAAIVRSAARFEAMAAENPFPEASRTEPNRVFAGLSKTPADSQAAAALEARGNAGERVKATDGALWFHYPGGAGSSKLSSTLIDRLVGSPLTARNWRTIENLLEMARP